MVRNQNGQELTTYEIGPYEVGQKLKLNCEVSGGMYFLTKKYLCLGHYNECNRAGIPKYYIFEKIAKLKPIQT